MLRYCAIGYYIIYSYCIRMCHAVWLQCSLLVSDVVLSALEFAFLNRSRAGAVGETSDGGFQARNEPGGRFWTLLIGLSIFVLWALCDLSITRIFWLSSLGTMVYCL